MKKYDYSQLIKRINRGLIEGILNWEDTLKIIRSDVEIEEYRPIIDYYCNNQEIKGDFEIIKVKNILKEIDKYTLREVDKT